MQAISSEKNLEMKFETLDAKKLLNSKKALESNIKTKDDTTRLPGKIKK